MRFYCVRCSKSFSKQEADVRFKRVTPSYPHGYYVCACGEKLVSCMKLLSRGLILKENDCNECDYRFKCYTGGYD